MKSSGIGGQAVIEGVMMRNQDVYAVAVRKPNGQIQVMKEQWSSFLDKHKKLNIPFVRGVFNFIDSLKLGMKILNYSASFYEEEEEEKDEKQRRRRASSWALPWCWRWCWPWDLRGASHVSFHPV